MPTLPITTANEVNMMVSIPDQLVNKTKADVFMHLFAKHKANFPLNTDMQLHVNNKLLGTCQAVNIIEVSVAKNITPGIALMHCGMGVNSCIDLLARAGIQSEDPFRIVFFKIVERI